jgi:hypothetical protein
MKNFTENNKLNFQTTFDRHNARLKLNYCLLPKSPNFSLLPTVPLKGLGHQMDWADGKQGLVVPEETLIYRYQYCCRLKLPWQICPEI